MSTGSIGSFGTRAFDSATQKCNMQKELSNEPTLHTANVKTEENHGGTHMGMQKKRHIV
jgi:hypothetical protein